MDSSHNLAPLFIGLDIGGTKIEATLLDHNLTPVAQVVQPTVTSSAEALVAAALHAIDEVGTAAAGQGGQLRAIGVGVPGLVEPARGLVRLAANLPLDGVPLGPLLTARCQLPVYVENDVRAAAWGAHWQARGTLHSLAYLNVGTGLSVGLVLDGRLYRGAHGMAGELGHMIVDPDGPLCNCGARGCLETLVAGPALARQGSDALGKPTTPRALLEEAEAGEPRATKVVGEVGTLLGQALHTLVMAYDVERIVLGGGVFRTSDVLVEAIRAEWVRRGERSALHRTLLRPEMVQRSDPAAALAACGVARLAWERLDPSRDGQETPSFLP